MAVKAGFNGDVYMAALPSVPFTSEATTADAARTRYTITNAARRYWDRKTALTVETSPDGAAWTPVTSGFRVQYVGGVVIFETARAVGTQVRVSGAYMTASQVGECHAWELSLDVDVANATKFGSQWATKVPVLKGGTAKLSQWFIDNTMFDALVAGQPLILVLYVDFTTGTRYEAYAYLNNRGGTVSADALVDTDLSLTIDGEAVYVPA